MSRVAAPSVPLVEALRTVADPEVPISIVDMGLVRGVERRGSAVHVRLTFTSMACPCMGLIIGDVRRRLLEEPGVESVEVEIDWTEPWSVADLSAEGRGRLREWGIVS